MNISPGDETSCKVCGKPAIGLEILGCCIIMSDIDFNCIPVYCLEYEHIEVQYGE